MGKPYFNRKHSKTRFLDPLIILEGLQNALPTFFFCWKKKVWPTFSFGTWHEACTLHKEDSCKRPIPKWDGKVLFKRKTLKKKKDFMSLQNAWPTFSFGTWQARTRKSYAKDRFQKEMGKLFLKGKRWNSVIFRALNLIKSLQMLGQFFSFGTWHEACARKNDTKGQPQKKMDVKGKRS